jgi:5'-deoxynucleotidase YfbR-like HD superfamily hydrolase
MRKGDYIGTYSGKCFWPLDPKPEEICLEDIAHALSQICRFTGHTSEHYSVLTHSLNVERLLIDRGYNELTQLYGLLHDAAEAYVGDMSRPMKICCPSFQAIEDGVQAAVYKHFGLPEPTPEIAAAVKEADNYILALEARRLMQNTEGWRLMETGDEELWVVKGGKIQEALFIVSVEQALGKIGGGEK